MPSIRADHLPRFQPKPNSLASQLVSVFLPKNLDVIVRSLLNRSDWSQRVIAQAVQRELLLPQPSDQQGSPDRATEIQK